MQMQMIDTPAVLVDAVIARRNIQAFQDYCDRHDLKVRPHIKTHKLPLMAKWQLEAGAIGITCQKIGEAEVMADAGIQDILITYNILGNPKLTRLRALHQRVDLQVVADNGTVLAGLSEAFQGEETPLTVLVECDTGAGRCGVQSPEAALDLARVICQLPGITFGGLMTYPPVGRCGEVEHWLTTARGLLMAAGFECPVISNGGTPDMWRAHEMPSATEYRIGTYIYNDRSLMARDLCGPQDCALTVLATVVSRPTDSRAIIDAGSKILTSDLLGLEGYGQILDHPNLCLKALSEEHGELFDPEGQMALKVGDRVRIIPNHACVVSNMVDEIHLIEAGGKITETEVSARGKLR